MIFNIPLSQSQYEVIHYLKGRYDKGEDFDYCNELDVIIKNIVLKNGSYLLNINTTELDLLVDMLRDVEVQIVNFEDFSIGTQNAKLLRTVETFADFLSDMPETQTTKAISFVQ